MQPIITIDGIDYVLHGSTIPADPQFDRLRSAYQEFGIQDRLNAQPVDGRGFIQVYELIDGPYKQANSSTDEQVGRLANSKVEPI